VASFVAALVVSLPVVADRQYRRAPLSEKLALVATARVILFGFFAALNVLAWWISGGGR
jgi:hypothetical protein